ncbi:unnamed protein product [Ostreobium quekettii]|uniref:S1 motif domain-containing protein n=1 Tax=Ostreobium quekettii TaxID=121088 RepID=A0A8S1J383_9CHLO|nr:unnamed protein product [Ostreobium quekettii]|eukprot:evm.model.scf_1326.3 EVM.evm.TU.scf_1326.3   scf_1326:18426-19322(+)
MALLVESTETADWLSLCHAGLSAAGASHLGAPTFVCVGDAIEIDPAQGFLRGHGTHVDPNGALRASVCGVLQRINKLVVVRPLKSRYIAETGDVVVGRVTSIAGRRWKVDLHTRQRAELSLAAVILPGGIQRRRTAEDELNMRGVFKEGDLISAEVQAVRGDGSVNLHTRSARYGLLGEGQALRVVPNLIRRQRAHSHELGELGVSLILGCNGMVWVAPVGGGEGEDEAARRRGNACRVANAVRALGRLCLPIFLGTVMGVVGISVEGGVAVREMGGQAFLERVVEWEAGRRKEMDVD